MPRLHLHSGERSETDGNIGSEAHRNGYETSIEDAEVLPSVDSYNWNYEAEKSYWFELSGRKERLQQLVDDGLQSMQCKSTQGPRLATDDNFKTSAQVKSEQSTELPLSDTLALENVDEKLQQMLQ